MCFVGAMLACCKGKSKKAKPKSVKTVHRGSPGPGKEKFARCVKTVVVKSEERLWKSRSLRMQRSYNTPLEHTPTNPPRELWKESLYSLLVKVYGCVPKVCWNNLRNTQGKPQPPAFPRLVWFQPRTSRVRLATVGFQTWRFLLRNPNTRKLRWPSVTPKPGIYRVQMTWLRHALLLFSDENKLALPLLANLELNGHWISGLSAWMSGLAVRINLLGLL